MLLPLRDNIPTKRTPVITYILIVANIVVFFFELKLGNKLQVFFTQVAPIPVEYWLPSLRENVPLSKLIIAPFVSMFLHGGWLHLLGNIWFLHLFGDNVEDRLGRWNYLYFYIICGLAGSAAHIVLQRHSNIPIVGASGAIFGVIGAYMFLFPRAKILTIIPIFFLHIIEIPAFLYIGIYFLQQLLPGMASFAVVAVGGVAYWAHIGGFVAGAITHRYLIPSPSSKINSRQIPRV